MKILLINHADIDGSAARAAYRIHHALRIHGVNSNMLVSIASAEDWTVEGPHGTWGKVIAKVRGPLGDLLSKVLKTGNPITHSPGVIPSRWSNQVNATDADVIHLHWVNREMISVADIGNIMKPLVVTLHDMWYFCGAEHYTEDYRWRDGYKINNRPAYESGFDLNRWTAMRKLKHWKSPMHIVTPSHWLADCVRQSVLMRDWPLSVIPNTIDTNVWKPVDKILARKLLGLPPGVPLLLFGAMGGAQDPRKGFDLLKIALEHLQGELTGLELMIFGQLAPKEPVNIGFPIHYAGHLHDNVSLRLLYSAADAIVVPSRQEAFGQTASEAHACGTPVVAFNATGLRDIVDHQITGYLANAYDPLDLAKGLRWVLNDTIRLATLGHQARARAEKMWTYERVAAQYESVYKAAICKTKLVK